MAKPDPQTIAQIKELMRRDLKLGPDIDIPDDMPFSGTEADFDSLDVLLLLGSIEKQFKIKIPSEAVGKEVFRNVSTLASYIDEQTGVGSSDELSRLPHQPPFRFLTSISQIEEGKSGQGVWNVKGDEPFLAGHFPGQPIVPGVLIAEALGQLSGLVGENISPEGRLVHVDVRFDQPVSPPAAIVLRSRVLRAIGVLQQFEVTALVGEAVIARGMLTLARPRPGTRVPGGALWGL